MQCIKEDLLCPGREAGSKFDYELTCTECSTLCVRCDNEWQRMKTSLV